MNRERFLKPLFKDLVCALPAGGAACAMIAENYINSTPWWTHIPWGWIVIISLAVWAGRFWEALWNERSDIRSWWRRFHRKFEVIHFVTASTDLSTGIDAIQPRIKIRFLKDTRSTIDLSVDTFIQQEYKRMFCECILPLSSYNKGNELTLPLATIHKNISLNSVWEASDNRGQKHNLLRQSENIATITIWWSGP